MLNRFLYDNLRNYNFQKMWFLDTKITEKASLYVFLYCGAAPCSLKIFE